MRVWVKASHEKKTKTTRMAFSTSSYMTLRDSRRAVFSVRDVVVATSPPLFTGPFAACDRLRIETRACI